MHKLNLGLRQQQTLPRTQTTADINDNRNDPDTAQKGGGERWVGEWFAEGAGGADRSKPVFDSCQLNV